MFLLLALACGEHVAESPDPWTPPGETGPWEIGTEEFLMDAPTAGEQLTVQTWFPASSGDPEVDVNYDWLLHSDAIGDAIPDCSAPRPVVLFSHGSQGIRFQSVFLTEHWATRGTITVAPDHIYNTFLDVDGGREAELAFRRPLDVLDAYDWLVAKAADPEDPFYGCVDPDAGYQVAGHSYGAFTALAIGGAVLDMSHLQATCEAGNGRLCEALDYWMLEHSDDLVIDLSDPRATSILSMTPGGWQVFGDGLANIDTPTFIMGAENDTVTTMEGDVLPVWERLVTTPRYLATLEQANHYSYTNLCEIAPFGDFCPDDGLTTLGLHRLFQHVIGELLDLCVVAHDLPRRLFVAVAQRREGSAELGLHHLVQFAAQCRQSTAAVLRRPAAQLHEALGVVADAFHVVDDAEQGDAGGQILLRVDDQVLEHHAAHDALAHVEHLVLWQAALRLSAFAQGGARGLKHDVTLFQHPQDFVYRIVYEGVFRSLQQFAEHVSLSPNKDEGQGNGVEYADDVDEGVKAVTTRQPRQPPRHSQRDLP